MTDEEYLREAVQLARRAKSGGNMPFGAIVVCDDKIIGRGYSTEISDRDVTAHAEMKAVREASKQKNRDLSDCTIYASGEPCTMCASAILHARIKRIVIGAARGDAPDFFRQRSIGIVELVKDASYKPEVIFGILKQEAINLFKD